MARILRITLVSGLIGLSALLFACASDDSEPDAPAGTPAATEVAGDEGDAATTVEAELTDFAFTLSAASAPAGEVTFEAANAGATPHEFVVIKTDLAQDALPLDGAVVDETAVDVIGEIEEFPAGESSEGTFDLEAGSYVLICNVAGHYQLGMHTPFSVE